MGNKVGFEASRVSRAGAAAHEPLRTHCVTQKYEGKRTNKKSHGETDKCPCHAALQHQALTRPAAAALP